MAARSIRSIVFVLAAALVAGAAAAQTASQSAQQARAAIDRADYIRAAAVVDDALRRFASVQSEPVWALKLMRAEIAINRGDRDQAKALLAEELPAPLRRSDTAVRRLILRASAEGKSELLNEALRLAKDRPYVLADVYASLTGNAPGGIEARERYMRKAVQLSRERGNRSAEVRAVAALAFTMIGERKRFSEALDLLDRAFTLAQEQQFQRLAEQIEGNTGWAYMELGDFETALELFANAEARAAKLGLTNDRVRWLTQLGNVAYYRGDFVIASRYYGDVVRLARSPLEKGRATANLAVIAIEQRRYADARRYNQAALALKQQAKDTLAELHSLVLDARIDAASGQLAHAEKTLAAVVARAANHQDLLWEARGRLAEVYAKGKQNARAEEQFRLAIDTIGAERKKVDRAELRFGFFNPATEILDAYVDFLIGIGRVDGALRVTEISRAQTLEEGRARNAPVPNAQRIARQRNATILCYWLGARRSYVWTVTPSQTFVRALPPAAQIARAAHHYRRLLLGPKGTPAYSGAAGERLYAMLVPRTFPKDARVIVVPDRELHALNFETLVVATPAPHYWIEDVLVVNAASLQLLASEEPNRRTAHDRLLLVGNPAHADAAYPPLPRAGEEVRRIAKHFADSRRTVIDRERATPSAYRNASPGRFDFVHFVAHGEATRRSPLDSAVILSPDARTKDYKLFARDVVQQPLRARLVTISSCHGAGTRTYAGEGLVGLAWAFLRAGASNVIAALWEVNDNATPQLMDAVYASLQRGRDPASSLRDAKLALLRSKSLYARPVYWAPFVLYAGS